MAEGSELRNQFRKLVLKMSPAEEKALWEERKIKGSGVAPPSFNEPLKAVFHLAGSLGYVFRSQLKPGVVKILLVMPAEKK